jgi:hypothetical protein
LEKTKSAAAGLKTGSEALGKMPGLMGVTGKAAGGLAGAMGGVTKVLAGWPGIIAMAVVSVVQAAVKIDSYIKGMNKKFAAIRGPEIMTNDVQKQFNEFNSAITNAGDNIRDGLRTDEVYDFMSAIAQTGKRISTLNDGFHSYREAVDVAAKASKVFGLDMAQTGSLMGELTTEYGMNLKDIDKSFVSVAFDAERSGIGTNKFLGAIENASVGLAFYGAYLKSASKTMATFTKDNIMGAKEAESATADMTQAFSKMNLQQGMAFMKLSRGGEKQFMESYRVIHDKAKDAYDIASKTIIELEEKKKTAQDSGNIDALEGIQKNIDEATSEQKKYFVKMTRMSAGSKGDMLAVAGDMGDMTEKNGELLTRLIQGALGRKDITGELSGTVSEVMKQFMGGPLEGVITAQTVQDIIAAANATRKGVENGNKKFITYLKEFKKENKKQDPILSGIEKRLEGINDKTDPNDLSDIADLLVKQMGFQKDDANSFIQSAASDKDFNKKLQDLINETIAGKGLSENSEEFLNKIADATGASAKNFAVSDKTDMKAQKAYDNTFDQIKKQTLSIEDILADAKDDLKWRAVSLSHLNRISTNVSDIADRYLGDIVPKSQKEATARIDTLITTLKGGANSAIINGKSVKKYSVDVGGRTASGGTYKDLAKELVQIKDEAMKQSKKDDKDLNILSSIEDSASNLGDLSKAQENLVEQMPDLEQAFMDGNKDDIKKQLDIAKKKKLDDKKNVDGQIKKTNDVLSTLEESKKLDETLVSLFTAQLLNGPEGKKSIQGIISQNFPTATKVNDLDSDTAKIAIQAGLVDKDGNLDVSQSRAGMKTPEVVTQAGPVSLHPGEIMLPKNLNTFKSAPIMDSNSSVSGGGAKTSGNISITVNANTRDLAQVIANEVRGVLYHEKVNNL